MVPRADDIELPGSIAIEEEGSTRVLCLRGELDSAVVARFRALQGAEPVVVDAMDAAEVTFISSTGLAIMLRTAEESVAAGHSPVLRRSSRAVDHLLRMSVVDDLFPRTSRPPSGPRD